MIVRILTEGQYEVSDDSTQRLADLDTDLIAAVHDSDEPRFHQLLSDLLGLVREHGSVLADDDLRQSEVMLPPADTTLQEARRDFSAEGLIPD